MTRNNENSGNGELYSREQIEGMIPDFAFNKLSEADRRVFEVQCQRFPELLEEAQRVQELFKKVDRMDFLNDTDRRTRNLSVKVQQRLQRSEQPKRSPWLRRYIPSFALILLVVVFFNREQIFNGKSGSFDEELAHMMMNEESTLFSGEAHNVETELPPSFVVHDIENSAQLSPQDEDRLDGLLAESLIAASDTDSGYTNNDEDDEATGLMNAIDIEETEHLILEVENGAS